MQDDYSSWPSGARDTTEFPKIEINLGVSFREHLGAFLKLEGMGWNDYDAQKLTSGLDVADSRMRTNRKMYERMGLIYRDNEKVRLSQLGLQMKELEDNLIHEKERLLGKIRETAVDILSRYQLRNPVDGADLPISCDILPCVCIWRAMRELDNKIHYEEMNRVILHVMKMSDLPFAIDRIRNARDTYGNYALLDDSILDQILGERVHTNQPSARIAPWFSFAGWGGLIIEQNQDDDGYRRLCNTALLQIDTILENVPDYFDTNDKDEWLKYYIGKAAFSGVTGDETSRETQQLDIENLTAKHCTGENILFYGVLGAGKSHEIDSIIDQERSERVVFHPDYTYSDFVGQILPRVVNEKLKYVFEPGPFTKMLKKAVDDPNNMYYLIIEEINRGNAPAIFGDIFQLLDRNDDGSGKYHISNYDIATIVYGDENRNISIPSNLTLLATMNTSDQNIFTLDTAFQRRWEMHLIKNDISKAIHAKEVIEGSKISWGRFATVTNEEIIKFGEETGSSEDKRLGAYFAKTNELSKDKFPEKVLKYLWDDAFKMDHTVFFNESMTSLDAVLDVFRDAPPENSDLLKRVLNYTVYQKMSETKVRDGSGIEMAGGQGEEPDGE